MIDSHQYKLGQVEATVLYSAFDIKNLSDAGTLTLALLYLTGEAFYRLALRPMVGQMRIPELTVQLQSAILTLLGFIPKTGTLSLSKRGHSLEFIRCHTHTHTHTHTPSHTPIHTVLCVCRVETLCPHSLCVCVCVCVNL